MPRDKHRDFRRNHQCRLKRGCRDGRPGGHRYRLPQSIQVPGEPAGTSGSQVPPSKGSSYNPHPTARAQHPRTPGPFRLSDGTRKQDGFLPTPCLPQASSAGPLAEAAFQAQDSAPRTDTRKNTGPKAPRT